MMMLSSSLRNVQKLPKRQTPTVHRLASCAASSCTDCSGMVRPCSGSFVARSSRRLRGTSVVPYATSSINSSVGESTAASPSSSPKFGLACSMGPRDEMEDELCCIPDFGGALYAGTTLRSIQYTLSCCCLAAFWLRGSTSAVPLEPSTVF